MPGMNRWARAAVAGAGAAALWAAVEPVLRRLIRTPFSDIRLLGAAFTTRRFWPLVALPIHLGNGALFGLGAEALGVRGWKKGLAAAEAETIALWPGMIVVDRYHPFRRNGTWPPLFTNPRALALTMSSHAVFGIVLGALLRRQ
jgi:hypothetical protein